MARACVIGTMRAVTAERIGTEAIRAAVVTRRMIGGMEAVDTVATTVAAGRVEEEGVMTIGGGTMIVIAAVGTMTAGGERTTGIIIGGASESACRSSRSRFGRLLGVTFLKMKFRLHPVLRLSAFVRQACFKASGHDADATLPS